MTQFCQSKKRIASEATLVAAFAVCLCTLVAASDLRRTTGIINYPHPGGDGGAPFAPMNQTGGFREDYVLNRIRVPLTRLFHADQDRLQAPQLTYLGAIRIGTPQKVYGVLFDTGTSEIWLPYYNWFPLANNLHYSIGYNCKDSSTCVAHGRESDIKYRGTAMSGNVYEDMITIYEDMQKDDALNMATPHIAFGQNFLGIENTSDEQFRWKAYDGVIGLAPVTQSSSGIRNLLLSMQVGPRQIRNDGNMMYRDQFDQYTPGTYTQDQYNLRPNPSHSALVFSIWLNPNQNARYGGEIMFGGVDENRYLGEIFFHRINSWFDWQLPVNGVQLGKHLISCANGCNAILETGVNPLIGPRKDVEKIYSQSQAHYDNDSELWLVDCERIEHLSTLVFQIDSTPYKLHPHQYIKRFNFRDQAICHMAIKSWDQPNWVLGNDFIGAYYTVFDLEHRRVGFATSRG